MKLNRLFLSVLLLLTCASLASAYTIVMRDGRRVEIPDAFTVNDSTIAYVVGSGIQVTIPLSTVDIAATERVNGQPKGSLLLNSSRQRSIGDPGQSRRAANRSITNEDLEGYRRARIQSELAYEKRRKQLGLPSREQQRRETAAMEERLRQRAVEMQAQEQNSEEYWRERATALRTEMASNQAQIDYVRRRLDELPVSYSFGAVTTTSPFGAFGAPVLNSPYPDYGRPGYYNPRYGLRNARRFPGGTRYGGRYPWLYGGGYGGNVLALPFESMDYSLERSELTSQLNQLQMDRAGMSVRWRQLEDEARRAGAYPGWLR